VCIPHTRVCYCAEDLTLTKQCQWKSRRMIAGVTPERGHHGLLHDGLGGGTRGIVEANVEAGVDGDGRIQA
jgi:hypothetical protein